MASTQPTREPKTESQLRLIKKYPNRRLYDTKTSSYITLADVKQMVIKQEEFQVVDAKSGDDLTRQILLQIILDRKSTRLNSSHLVISYAVFCLKKKKKNIQRFI